MKSHLRRLLTNAIECQEEFGCYVPNSQPSIFIGAYRHFGGMYRQSWIVKSACCLLGLTLGPEYGGSTFFRNVSNYQNCQCRIPEANQQRENRNNPGNLYNLCRLKMNGYMRVDSLCGLVVRVIDYRSRGPAFDSRALQKKVVSLERGPLSLVSTTEELLDRKVATPV
jgi:hypothetical protein